MHGSNQSELHQSLHYLQACQLNRRYNLGILFLNQFQVHHISIESEQYQQLRKDGWERENNTSAGTFSSAHQPQHYTIPSDMKRAASAAHAQAS
jgi:hypothetical protein